MMPDHFDKISLQCSKMQPILERTKLKLLSWALWVATGVFKISPEFYLITKIYETCKSCAKVWEGFEEKLNHLGGIFWKGAVCRIDCFYF